MSIQRLSDQTVSQVKASREIVTIISDYVQLKKRGRNHVGLCPFHSEKTPSFTVSEDKQIYHCFGCQQSGDAIGFMMAIDQLSFVQAIEHIAQKLSIQIEYDHVSAQDKAQWAKIEKSLDALSVAKQFFMTQFQQQQAAQAYAANRGLTSDTLYTFSIGYAPDRNYLVALTEQGVSDDGLLDAGLAIRSDSGQLFPRFRDRLMFPVLDYRGRVVGFGGRLISHKSDAPKYLNSPETQLFNKSRLVYGLLHAKKTIQATDLSLIMEGYMDVVLAHQYGFTQAVATMGTAITAQHLQKLGRFSKNVIMAMDSDQAGQAAITKSIETFETQAFNVRVMDLLDGDPADLLTGHGPEMFKTQMDGALPLIQFHLERLIMTHDMTQIHNVRDIVDKMSALIKTQKDPLMKRHFAGLVAKRLDVDLDIVLGKVTHVATPKRAGRHVQPTSGPSKQQKAERFMLFALITCPELRGDLPWLEMVSDAALLRLMRLVNALPADTQVLAQLEDADKADVSGLLIEYEGLEPKAIHTHMAQCIDVLTTGSKKQQIQALKDQIKVAEAAGEDEQVQRLSEQLNHILLS